MPTPEIIAHRGASRERPENTLAAFERAAELGADGCEFDVHLHGDGVLRIHHDPLPSGAALPTGPAAPPTLDEVLALHRDRGLTAYAELKGPGCAPGTLAAITASGVRAAVHAFDHRQVAEARRLAPDIPRGVLEVSYPVDALHALKAVGGRDLWRQWPFVDEALVDVAHAAGCRIVAWTVNDPEVMERLGRIGVDAICTDDVALSRRVLGA
ncbi:MAG: glycerophosphodiester phosphodiesterase [Gemmatimonadaceae bacterium]|nr:glycerophosphodiester phosphodiesterase [Gemmatimonadaceae bacterium]MCW5825218.1 glycerophosphodiester phosphodiesterase [Gemmatimonadaceae bacterium]